MDGMDARQMDVQAMCKKHKAMTAGNSSAEQQIVMNEHMKSMSQEFRTHMHTMQEKCKAS